MPAPDSIKQVVQNGLCIGCGLCESLTCGRVSMQMTSYGALRPASLDQFSDEEERALLAACPGATVSIQDKKGAHLDAVWGSYETMRYAWAASPQVRFESATGGVLTGLAQHLLNSGEVSFILHVSADDENPLRNRWVISSTADEVLANGGSRYAPTAPLAGLHTALARCQPFAIVAKPCDISAVSALAQQDSRIDKWCRYRLALVCGGQSRLSKTLGLLEQFCVDPGDVKSVNYRGYGNPGPTRVVTHDGEEFTTTYNALWSDASSWDLESRCAVCPDALGEAADIAAADVWPGGTPEGEDEGFNGVIVRTQSGVRLLDAAVAAGGLVLGDAITPEQFDHFQPHQVTKKVALNARFGALESAGKPVIASQGLRLDELGKRQSDADRIATINGTLRRIKAGRFSETVETFISGASLDDSING